MKQKETVDMGKNVSVGSGTASAVIATGIDLLVKQCHAASFNRGWWHDPITGASLIPGVPDWTGDVEAASFDHDLEVMIKAWFPYVIGTKIALIHSETSEGLEAYRVDKMDDKIPAFKGVTAEMADVVIRVADLMGCLQWYEAGVTKGEVPAVLAEYDLGAAILAKIPFNAGRADHGFTKRAEPTGKRF